MMYILNNGWTVTKKEEGRGLLHIIPKSDSTFNEGFTLLPRKWMVDIENGEKDIFFLLKKYDYNPDVLYPLHGGISVIPDPKPNIITEYCYQGKDYFVTQEGNKYFLEYYLGRHGGGSRKFEINKEIYEYARQDSISSSEIFRKYNLYCFDIPENDVKELILKDNGKNRI